jgi:hypothetical protein
LRPFLGQSGWAVYGAVNLLLVVALLVGAAIGGGSLAELPYVVLLFAICASTIPFVGALNGAYAVLAVAMAHYFIEFALLDAVHMFSPPQADLVRAGLLSAGEVMILTGALLKIMGFHAVVRFTLGKRAPGAPKDWPPIALLLIGLGTWAASSALNLYEALYLLADNSDAAAAAASAKLGVLGTNATLLVTHYLGPLGIMILAYWWSVWHRRGSSALMIVVIVAQFIVGWIVDTKEIAIGAPIIMLLTRFIALGRVPARWGICTLLGVLLVFPVLTAKRIIVTEGLHLTRAQALSQAGEILMRSISERDIVRQGTRYAQKSQSFLERATDKAAVEMFAEHVGRDKPFKMGATLDQVLYVFVPRFVWSDKPGENTAETFNRDFHLSEDPDTHISPTHLGELYWNFGYPGVIVGMLFFGALLGYVSGRFDPSVETSITRVLVIMVTLYDTAVGSGGQIDIAYVLWMRTLVLIWLLHLLLSRPVAHPALPAKAAAGAVKTRAAISTPIRFENLLR